MLRIKRYDIQSEVILIYEPSYSYELRMNMLIRLFDGTCDSDVYMYIHNYDDEASARSALSTSHTSMQPGACVMANGMRAVWIA